MQKATELLLLTLNGAIDRVDGPVTEAELEAALALARHNKLLLPFCESLLETRFGDRVRPVFNQEQRLQSVTNSLLVATAVQASRLLGEAGIVHASFKGPIQQKKIFNAFYGKMSSDLDILVLDEDFDQARETLCAAGYLLPPECDRSWWRNFLGEQHLVRQDGGILSIDLHHKVQQPGCPSPRHIGLFLEELAFVEAGQARVPTFSTTNTALIVAMNIVKAISNGERCGGHVYDLACLVKGLGEQEREALEAMALRQNLQATLRLALARSERFFGAGFAASSLPANDPEAQVIFETAVQRQSVRRRFSFLADLADNSMSTVMESMRLAISECARVLS